MIDFVKILHNNGFYDSGTCNCSGVVNKKYRFKEIVVYVRESRNQFLIKQGVRRITPLLKLDDLENAIKNLQEKA